jgi:hypothetical protein
MSQYLIDFERIGRTHNPPSLTVESDDPDEVAYAVFCHARRYLASRDFGVFVDLDEMRGHIDAGRFGRFTITTDPVED